MSYPLWRAHYMITLSKLSNSVDQIWADDGISFVDGAFVSSLGETIEVYTTAGCRVANNNLSAGIYIAVTPSGRYKIAVK